MTIQQLQYVVEVAKSDSINKAAQNLFISQPTLSVAIKELEEEIGTSLFQRSRKGIAITNDGIEFLRLAEEILGKLDYVKKSYLVKSASTISRFQVSCQHYAFVVEAFIQFMDKYKDSRFHFTIKETKTLACIEDVYQRKSILSIIYLNSANENLIRRVLTSKSMEFHEMYTVKPHVFLRKAHPLAGKSIISAEDLAPFPMIAYEQEKGEYLGEEMIIVENPDKVISTQDRGTTNNIIANTDGYNIGTGYIIPGIISDEITSIPLDVDDEMQVGWISLANRELTDEIIEFVSLVKASMKKHHPCKRSKKG